MDRQLSFVYWNTVYKIYATVLWNRHSPPPQIRHADGQEVYDKILNINNYQETANQKHKRYHPIPVRMAISKKIRNINNVLMRVWRNSRSCALLLGVWIAATPIEKQLCRFLKKFKRVMLYDSLILLLAYLKAQSLPQRPRFDSWVGKILWRRKGQPIPVFLPGEPHGQRNLAGYSAWCCRSWTQLND